jgi:hypothetical protein
MTLFASVIVLAFVLGFALGGRLSRFEGVRVRWWGLALAGLAVQFVPLPEGVGGSDLVVRTVVLAASYVALIVFAAVNVRMPGLAVILVGLSLNAIVITANGGMPVSASALRASDQADVLADLQRSGADKHHLQTDGDVLTFLGDVIPIPSPIAQVVSVGDTLVYAGLVWFVVAAMRGRIRPARSRRSVGYHGRHRLEEPEAAPPDEGRARVTPGSPGAATSGTEP